MLYSNIIVFSCIVLINTISAFRIIPNHRFNTRLLMTTTESTEILFKSIRDQINSSLTAKAASGKAPSKFIEIVRGFVDEYAESYIEAKESPETFQYQVTSLLKFVQNAIESPYKFQPLHKAIREPFDYHKWGNDFMRPLIMIDKSRLVGLENAKKIQELVKKGENVIILSNHQTEVDPQAISILLEKEGLGAMAENIIFIAGHKVTNDPIAIPFSMGRNLICIHSKKHIKNPPEDFPMKQKQNMDSMKEMGDLINAGGNIIWLAPSGGRDRPDPTTGKFVVAPFDFKSLDMFKLMAMQSQRPLHFFPMAMYTHKLVPPPSTAATAELGEARSAKRGPISVHFMDETDGLGGLKDKVFSAELQQRVEVAYADLVKWHEQ